MRCYFFGKEYIPAIERWEKKLKKSLNPKRRKECKQNIEILEKEMLRRYPILRGQSREFQKEYLKNEY